MIIAVRPLHILVQYIEGELPSSAPLYRRPGQYLPRSADEVVDQALQACRRAYADGIRRQQLELLLPLIGATDIDDW